MSVKERIAALKKQESKVEEPPKKPEPTNDAPKLSVADKIARLKASSGDATTSAPVTPIIGRRPSTSNPPTDDTKTPLTTPSKEGSTTVESFDSKVEEGSSEPPKLTVAEKIARLKASGDSSVSSPVTPVVARKPSMYTSNAYDTKTEEVTPSKQDLQPLDASTPGELSESKSVNGTSDPEPAKLSIAERMARLKASGEQKTDMTTPKPPIRKLSVGASTTPQEDSKSALSTSASSPGGTSNALLLHP